MINNNPYNIPQKKPLSQSKILSETNTSRHSSTYLQNRNGNQVMYSSSIFLKNPSVNGGCDQSFFQPIKQPLSPHHAKYTKPPKTVQFIPAYNNAPIRPPENHFFPLSAPKENNIEKCIFEMRQKIDNIDKRLQAREKKESNFSEGQNKKPQNLSEIESINSITEEDLYNNTGLKQLIDSIIQSTFDSQNRKIWQKLSQIDENIAFSTNNSVVQKLSTLEESFFRLQSDKPYDEHLNNRLKTIEKTIREMGEDIHLINDKEQSLSSRIQTELPSMRNQIKALKGIEKRVTQNEKRIQQVRNEVEEVAKKLRTIQTTTQSSLMHKIKDIDTKLQSLRSQNKDIKPSFERCFSEPSILKYIQKYQVSKPHLNHYSYSNSTKDQSCEQIIINEITYFIDHEGYLLDNDRYYLTNGVKNERIRLDIKHVEVLKEKKILI